MWQRAFGIPAPPVWPLALTFTLSLTVAAAHAAAPGLLPAGLSLAALVGVAARSARRTTIGTALGVGSIAWLFDNGFVVHQLGSLHWRASTDAPTLALLIGCAVASALVSGRPVAQPPADVKDASRAGFAAQEPRQHDPHQRHADRVWTHEPF